MKPANPKDIETVIRWIQSSEEAKLWGGPKIRYPLCIHNLLEDIGFSDHHSFSFISNDELFGFAQIVDIEKGVGHIARVIIKPDLRGRGFGNRIFGDLIKYCDSNTYKQLKLNVYLSNSAAINLYRSFGFQITKTDDSNSSFTMSRNNGS